MKKILSVIPYLLIAILIGITVSFAGSLTPPGSPANTMYSLTDIYNLSAGTTTTEGAGTIPSTPGTVASSGKTLTEVYTAISDQIALLANNKIAKDITAFGYTGTLYGDTDPSKVLTTATYAGTASGPGLLKTNQTTCYINATDSSPQDPCLDGTNSLGGQDGYYQEGIALSYTDNGDGTISDNATGLMWKKCSEGKTGVTCATGSTANETWTQALAACEADTTGGYTDWRLPNIRELLSLLDYGTISPSIDSVFDSENGQYWSSTSYVSPVYRQAAYFVDFDDSYMRNFNKTGSLYVRCVR